MGRTWKMEKKRIMPTYVEGFRYNYGAIDFKNKEGSGVARNVMAGIQPQKLTYEITRHLNEAVAEGFGWAAYLVKLCKAEKDFDKCLKDKGL